MAKQKVYTDKFGDLEVMVTTDYSIFKTLPGNRTVSKTHVKELINLILTNGNMTDRFPIIINKEGYVIDGQHRLAALQELNWEVGYIVETGGDIETVRAINQGNRNWAWRDVAVSHAELGNSEYEWFLSFADKYELPFQNAMKFAGHKNGRNRNSSFYRGELVTKDKAKAVKMAEQAIEVLEIIENPKRDFVHALHGLMLSPFYDQERMLRKLKQLGSTLPSKASIEDYKRDIEKIYNHDYAEKVRLF